MLGIGMPEMIIILIVALVVLGPNKLPDIAKALGRAFNEFKKATNDFKESMEINNELQNVKHTFDEMNSDMKETIDLKPERTIENASPSDSDKAPHKTDTDISTDAK